MNPKVNVAGRISRHQWGVILDREGVSTTVCARDYKTPILVVEYGVHPHATDGGKVSMLPKEKDTL